MSEWFAPGAGSSGAVLVDESIAGAVERGMNSDNFDFSGNVAKGAGPQSNLPLLVRFRPPLTDCFCFQDQRQVDPALFEMEAIVQREGCNFDEVRYRTFISFRYFGLIRSLVPCVRGAYHYAFAVLRPKWTHVLAHCLGLFLTESRQTHCRRA